MLLSANGYAVLAIDSFSPRNFGPFVQKYGVCTGLTLWGRERSADLMTALYMIQRGVGVDILARHTTDWDHRILPWRMDNHGFNDPMDQWHASQSTVIEPITGQWALGS